MTEAITESKPESKPESKNKKPSRIGLLYDPYLDGCRDLGGNPDYPPLRSRQFLKKQFTSSGEIEYVGITVRPDFSFDNDAQLWEELKEIHPLINELIRKGAIIEYSPKTESKASTLVGYSVTDAKDIIERIRGVAGIVQLQEWAKVETRQSVQDSIFQRIEAIRTGRV